MGSEKQTGRATPQDRANRADELLDQSRRLAEQMHALTEQSRTELKALRADYEQQLSKAAAERHKIMQVMETDLRSARRRSRVLSVLLVLAIVFIALVIWQM
jgi:thymidine phosphorylase